MFEQSSAAVLSPATTPGSAKVQRVVERIESELDRGRWRPGERISTVRALAGELGVTTGVAHTAVRHLHAKGRLTARQGSGTFVSQSPMQTQSSVVHLLTFGKQPGFFAEIEPLYLALQANGLTCMATMYDDKDTDALQRLVEGWYEAPPRAVILKGLAAPVLRVLGERDLPASRFLSAYRKPTPLTRQWHNVCPDETEAFRVAAAYLIEQGHRRIGMPVSYENKAGQKPDHPGVVNKIAGIRMAFEQAGLPDGLDILFKPLQRDDEGQQTLDHENIQRTIHWLTGPNRPTAVIDRLYRFASLRLAMREAGLRNGHGIEIVGVGNPGPAELAEFTCVSEEHEEIAAQIIDIITSNDASLERAARHVLVRPRLLRQTHLQSPSSSQDGASS